jgi:hypothetical protein
VPWSEIGETIAYVVSEFVFRGCSAGLLLTALMTLSGGLAIYFSIEGNWTATGLCAGAFLVLGLLAWLAHRFEDNNSAI